MIKENRFVIAGRLGGRVKSEKKKRAVKKNMKKAQEALKLWIQLRRLNESIAKEIDNGSRVRPLKRLQEKRRGIISKINELKKK